MKAGIYVRVSTTQQIDRDSLRTQEERLRQYCKAQNFEIYKNKPYKDEGISAKDTKRPGFEELMHDIKAGRINIVVVTRLDRITRSLKDLIDLMEFLQQHDVKLISLTENIDTMGPMGRFLLNLLGSIAQLEREIDSERVSADMHHRALSGKWTGGVVPLGYTTKGKLIHKFLDKGMKDDEALKEANRIAPEKGRLYLVKQEAELIRKIYQLYLERKSLRRVTHELNEKGIKTPEGETWAATSIRRILTNPTYIGMVWYGKRKTDLATGKLKPVKQEFWKIVKGEHEAVIPEETFEKVQSLLKQRCMKPSKSKEVYLLSSLLRCGLCKGGMFGYIYFKKKYDKQYFYYRCRNCAQKGRAVCKGMVVPAGVVEKAVIDTLLDLCKNEKFLHQKEKLLEKLKQMSKPVKSEFNDEKKRLVQEEKRLVDVRTTLLEKLENKIIDDVVFVERFDENKRQLDGIRNSLASLVSQGEEINLQEIALQTSYEDLCNLPRTWPHLTDEGKREKLRSIINQVIVHYDKAAGKIKLDMELFVDSADAKRRDRFHFVVIPCRRDVRDEHNDNILPLVYTLEISLNLNDFNPKYPQNPQTFGEKIRKARMDKGLMIKEFASQIGVTEETVINWEIRDIKPVGMNLERIREFIKLG